MDSRKASYLALAVILMAGTAAATVETRDRIDSLTVRGEAGVPHRPGIRFMR